MNMTEYQHLAQRTSPDDGHDRIENGILGLIGETGEIVDLYKKYMFQSSPGAALPAERMEEELGDVLWYIAELCTGLNRRMKDYGTDFIRRDIAAQNGGRPPELRSVVIKMSRCAGRIAEHAPRKDSVQLQLEIDNLLILGAWLARIIGSSLEKAARRNIEKLRKRYPVKFDPEISEARYR